MTVWRWSNYLHNRAKEWLLSGKQLFVLIVLFYFLNLYWSEDFPLLYDTYIKGVININYALIERLHIPETCNTRSGSRPYRPQHSVSLAKENIRAFKSIHFHKTTKKREWYNRLTYTNERRYRERHHYNYKHTYTDRSVVVLLFTETANQRGDNKPEKRVVQYINPP